MPLLLCLLIGAPPTTVSRTAGGVTLRVSAPSEIALHEDLPLTVRVTHPPGVAVTAPAFGAGFGDFAVEEVSKPRMRAADGMRETTVVVRLAPTGTGTLTVLPVRIALENGPADALTSDAFAVRVRTEHVPTDASIDALAAAPGPLPLHRGTPWWWWLAAGVGALVLVAFVAALLRRRRPFGAAVRSPSQQAHAELDQLLATDLRRRDVKEFHVRLSGIVRRYLERATGLRAPEWTTEEFLRHTAAGARLEPSQRQRLRPFLEAADLVKFAGDRPPPDRIEESIATARVAVSSGRDTFGAAAPATGMAASAAEDGADA